MMFSLFSRRLRSSRWLLCALALATLQACGKHADEAAKPAAQPEVEYAVAQRSDAPLETELPGRLEPYRTAEVRARVDGIVLKRAYEEGQVVKAGQVLFRIDPAPLKAQVAELESGLQKIKSDNGAVPPGYHAQLGMLYAGLGKDDQMVQEFNTEKTLFPESATYIDFLMKNVKKGTN